MSENPTQDEVLAMPDSTPDAAKTAGQLLKAARLRAGVHLADLSVILKIPVRQLEALEEDKYQSGQSPVFVRGLASSVCRQLRLDPLPVLALLPHAGTYLEPHGAVRQAYVRPADFGRMRGASPRSPVRAWWAATSMLVMIAALIWLPSPAQWAWLDQMAALSTASAPEVRTVTSEPEAQATSFAADAAPLGAVSEVPAVVLMPPSSLPVTTALESPVAIQNLPSAANAAPMSPTPPASGSVPQLQFTAIENSSIEVRDAKNRVVWNGVLKAGETHRVPTPQAVNVVINRASAIQVTFKGQAFDLKPHTKVNVARFEVQP